MIDKSDTNEYEHIVSKYYALLFKYCYYRLESNKELTEETINDVFCALYKKWHTLDREDNLLGWLYHVADLEIKQHRRKYNIYYTHNAPLDDSIKSQLNEVGYTDEYFVTDVINEEEYLDQIELALPQEYREIFRYRFVEKHTLMETSAYVGIPYSSLRLRIGKIETIVRSKVRELFNN